MDVRFSFGTLFDRMRQWMKSLFVIFDRRCRKHNEIFGHTLRVSDTPIKHRGMVGCENYWTKE